MTRVEQLLRTAVGFDKQRGDQVTVINVQFPNADGLGGGVVAANPLMGFDKNDIMQLVQWVILLIVALLTIFFVVRPLFRSGMGARTGVTRLATTGDGQRMLPVDPSTGGPLALPGADQTEMEQRIESDRNEGQGKAIPVKRGGGFGGSNPYGTGASPIHWSTRPTGR